MVADYINHIGEGLDAAVENSLKNERMKTELITNVSHDIKTPAYFNHQLCRSFEA